MSDLGSQLDLSSDVGPVGSGGGAGDRAAQVGAFLGVTFACCDIYARIYPNRRGDAYEGRCPRCLKSLRAGIGPGGTSQRFFTAK